MITNKLLSLNIRSLENGNMNEKNDSQETIIA